jgi:hypothetical protein
LYDGPTILLSAAWHAWQLYFAANAAASALTAGVPYRLQVAAAIANAAVLIARNAFTFDLLVEY